MYLSKSKVQGSKSKFGRRAIYSLVLTVYCLLAMGCGVRFDMQDQPRYKSYKKSEWYKDGRSSREMPSGTVARGQLRDNKGFYTGKVDNPSTVAAETTMDASGNSVVSSFPNDIEEFPIPVTKELVDRGQERYNIHCIVCHGPLGSGDGMIVRRGFSKPPTFHDERLRNAPVGHFFDVIANGWGKMSSYAYQVQPADRWAIAAYIRALQVSQNPDQNFKMNTTTAPKADAPKTAAAPAGATNGGVK